MMRKLRTRRSVVRLLGFLALSFAWEVSSAATSPSQTSDARRWSGSAAVQRAGRRLPEIAARNQTTAAELEKKLLHDPTLWIDANDRLFYIEAPVSELLTSQAPIAAGFDPGASTFLLHSQPGAQRVIYLDFDGHNISGTAWNTGFELGGDCYAEPYGSDSVPESFNQEERESIYGIWQLVSEDYAPFGIDVTTEDPGEAAIERAGVDDLNYGTRVVITDKRTRSLCPNSQTLHDSLCLHQCGGIAYVGVFDEPTQHAVTQPALVFGGGTGKWIAKWPGEIASHEAGHTLGLTHDGTPTEGYYLGHRSWTPIMGSGGLTRAISQFSKGEYPGANNAEDDFAVMQSHGADLLADDHGDARATATALVGPTPFAAGTITTRSDVDVFEVTVTGGLSTFSATAAPTSPNLDILLELRDSSDALIASSDPAATSSDLDTAVGLDAEIIRSLGPGTYYLWVSGVGVGFPGNGYSDYGSVGNYTLDGTLDAPTVTCQNQPAGSSCGSSSDTDCDNPDTCDGEGNCQANYESSTVKCAEDADLCTDDTCDGGGFCDHTYNAVSCQAATLCGPEPLPSGSCRLNTPGMGSIQLKIGDLYFNNFKDRVNWKWSGGAATNLSDFNDPLNGSASMQFCVYDGSGIFQPIQSSILLPSGTCGTTPCWKANGTTGYSLLDTEGVPQGLLKAQFKSGIDGKAQVQVRGGGANLVMPLLPLTLPVVVQLLIDDGFTTECWQTTFSTPAKNEPQQFKAKGP